MSQKSYLMIYCVANPDTYLGHYTHRFKADNMDQAKEIGLEFVKGRLYQGKIEIQINEVTEQSSYRVYDTVKQKYL